MTPPAHDAGKASIDCPCIDFDVVYRNPTAHPGKWVIRRWTVTFGVALASELCEIEDSYSRIARWIKKGRIKRQADVQDDPSIWEIWI